MSQLPNFEYDVFLSFSAKDTVIAREIWEKLEEHQLEVFWSDNYLKKELGINWFKKVEEALEQSRHLVVLVTKNSLNSEWVQREYQAFLNSCYKEKSRRLVPLLGHEIRISDMPLFMQQFQSFRLEDTIGVYRLVDLLQINSIRRKKEAAEREKRKQEEQLLKEKLKLEEDNKNLDQNSSNINRFELSEFEDPRDHSKYRTIKIGNQVWFAENLRYQTPESRLYKNNAEYAETFGRLYNWLDAQNACPAGWRIPDYGDWEELIMAFGGYRVAGEKLKHSSAVFSDISELEHDFNSGFSALYGGMGIENGYGYLRKSAYFWSSDEYNEQNAWRYALYVRSKGIHKEHLEKELYYSVRCIRNS